jgi:hypothetical protein
MLKPGPLWGRGRYLVGHLSSTELHIVVDMLNTGAEPVFCVLHVVVDMLLWQQYTPILPVRRCSELTKNA